MVAWNKGKIEWKQCLSCNNKIRKWLKYCSSKCYILDKPRKSAIVKSCLICQKIFTTYLSNKNKKSCSIICGKKLAGISKRGKNHIFWGRKLTLEERKRLTGPRLNTRGKKHHNWKGGVTSQNRLERVKFQQTIQKLIFERDSYTCQMCGSVRDLQVDHIKPWANYPKLRFNMKNCRTLCAKCHYQITFNRPMPDQIKGWGHNLLRGGTENFN